MDYHKFLKRYVCPIASRSDLLWNLEQYLSNLRQLCLYDCLRFNLHFTRAIRHLLHKFEYIHDTLLSNSWHKLYNIIGFDYSEFV